MHDLCRILLQQKVIHPDMLASQNRSRGESHQRHNHKYRKWSSSGILPIRPFLEVQPVGYHTTRSSSLLHRQTFLIRSPWNEQPIDEDHCISAAVSMHEAGTMVPLLREQLPALQVFRPQCNITERLRGCTPPGCLVCQLVRHITFRASRIPFLALQCPSSVAPKSLARFLSTTSW